MAAAPGDQMNPSAQIEMHLLHILQEDTPTEYKFGYYFSFGYLVRATGYDREIVRGFMRSMRNRGLVQFGTGFSEDGMTAGGGYTLVPAGLTHWQNLRVEMRNEQQSASDLGDHRAEAASWASTNYM